MLDREPQNRPIPLARHGFEVVERGMSGFEKRCWEGRVVGDTISFRFNTTSAVFVLAYVADAGGTARVYVDGEQQSALLNLKANRSKWQWLEAGRGLPTFFKLANKLQTGIHVVNFTVVQPEDGDNSNRSVQIIALATF